MNKKLDLILYIFFLAAVCALFASCKKEVVSPAAIHITSAVQYPGSSDQGIIHIIGTVPNITDSVVIYNGAAKVDVAKITQNEVLNTNIIIKSRSPYYELDLIAYPSGVSTHYSFKP